MNTIYLHIGSPKTGTTSIQSFLTQNFLPLRKAGRVFCRDLSSGKANFKSLYSVCVDERGRQGGPRIRKKLKPVVRGRFLVWLRLRRFFKAHGDQDAIISSESLFLLRDKKELSRLRGLFPRKARIVVILVLRNKRDFLNSYAEQLKRQEGRAPSYCSRNRQDFNYLGADSWIADYDQPIAAYRAMADEVRVIDYDETIARDGNILPAFMKAVGIKPEGLDLARFYFNVSPLRASKKDRAEEAAPGGYDGEPRRKVSSSAYGPPPRELVDENSAKR